VSLSDWRRNRWLIEQEPTRLEVGELLAVADRDLADAQASGLSPDWRLNIAYSAALQLATAALAACGYRATRDSHHHRVIQSLAHTAGMHPDRVALLDSFRKKRNLAAYERAGAVSEAEADEMLAFARELRKAVLAWLADEHADLLP